MNKNKIFSLFILLMTSLLTFAQENTLSIPDITYGAGKQLAIPVELNNSSDIVAAQFDIQLPYTKVADSLITARANGHEVIVKALDYYTYWKSNCYRVYIYSANNEKFRGSAGKLMTFSVNLPDDLTNGSTLNANILTCILSDRDGNNVSTGSRNGIITIEVVPRPDLVPFNAKVLQTSVEPGGTLNFTWNVRNDGDSITGAGWTEKIFLENENGDRVYVGTTAYESQLAAGQSVSRSMELTLDDYPGISGECRPFIQIIPSADCGEITLNQDNNTTRASSYTLRVKKYLTFTTYKNIIPENSTGWYSCEVRRTGDFATTQTFTAKQSDAEGNAVTRLELENDGKVTFNTNASKAYLRVRPIDNTDINIDPRVVLVLNADQNNGYGTVSDTIRIEENDRVPLTLTLDKTEYNEGETIHATLSTTRYYPGNLNVYLSIEESKRFKLPARIVLEEGVSEKSFDIPVLQDKTPANDVSIKISATADMYSTAEALFILHDDDVPAINLTLTPKTVSESAGPSAIYGTITRSGVTDNKITVKLSDDGLNDIYYSTHTITMPAGTTTVNFPLGVVDNSQVDGDRLVHIRAAVYMTDCNCDAIGDRQSVVVDSITITDNDGPVLTLSTSKSTVLEGDVNGATVTVSRNTGTSEALTVTLACDGTDIELPSAVTIPAGQQSVSFNFKALSNSTEEGDRTVAILATATGFSTGSCWLLISDRTLPDATITDLTLSATSVNAGDNVTATVKVKNIGAAALPAGTIVNLYQNGTSVSEVSIPAPLPMGEEQTYTLAFQTSDVAWDHITMTPEIEAVARRTQAVCFGTLAQRSETTRNTLRSFLDLIPNDAAHLKIFDVNLRRPFAGRDIVEPSLQRSNVLKLNDEELPHVAALFGFDASDPLECCTRLRHAFDLRLLVLTCGTAGSYVFHDSGVSFRPTPHVLVADTVGAGDAFTGTLCAALLEGCPVGEAHRRAVEVSAYVCTCRGAMPPKEM